MKSKLLIIILSCMLLILLSACTGQTYGSANQKQAEAKGREEVTAFLNANLPDAKLLSVKAVEANREMTLKTLTNYVCGEYEFDYSKYDYYYDLHNGKMYTSRDFYVLERLVEEQVMSDLGLPDTAEIISSDIRIYLPDLEESDLYNDDVGSGDGKLPSASFLMPVSAPVLPFEAVGDVEAYFGDEDRREVMEVAMEIVTRPEDHVDFESFSLEGIGKEEEKAGIYFRSLVIHNAYSVEYFRNGNENKAEVVDLGKFRKQGRYPESNQDFATYESFHIMETDGSASGSLIYRRQESYKDGLQEITVNEEYFD